MSMACPTDRDIEACSQPTITIGDAGFANANDPANGSLLERDATVQFLRDLVLGDWEHFAQSANGSSSYSKEDLRQKHAANRLEILKRDHAWIAQRADKLLGWFACGPEVVPAEISPCLVPVETREQQDLFRLARYAWSLPYSKGYGRRLKFLIIDCSNVALHQNAHLGANCDSGAWVLIHVRE